eukprot:scaffold203_cov386-Prasinococcus_capsulatus_cf.AAC.30
MLQRFLNVEDWQDLEAGEYFRREITGISDVSLGNDHSFDTTPMRRQQLVPYPAHGKNQATQGELPCHCCIRPYLRSK